MQRTSVNPTPQQLKALTHPVRLRMLGMLRIDGPATATTLAARLGLNTGATSYHLRQLAQHGFVVDDEERGTGRERWWRAAHTTTQTERPDPDDVEAQENLDAYVQSIVTVYAEQMQRAVEERPLLPEEWRTATTFSDWQPRLTPARARQLLERLYEVITEFETEHETEEPDESGAPVTYSLHVMGFPRPGGGATEDRS